MIRQAQPKDAEEAIELALIVLHDMELEIFNLMDEAVLKKLMIEAFISEPTHRYGYENALVKIIDNQVAGVAFGYPDELEDTIDDGYLNILNKHGFSERYLMFDQKEAFENEWYLDTLVTSPKFRGQGIAKQLLEAVQEPAKRYNKNVIGLNVDLINTKAKKLYSKCGFQTVGEMDIAGHRYEHMHKKISI